MDLTQVLQWGFAEGKRDWTQPQIQREVGQRGVGGWKITERKHWRGGDSVSMDLIGFLLTAGWGIGLHLGYDREGGTQSDQTSGVGGSLN